MATFNDNYPAIPGPLTHTPPLFYKLNVLTIFDIYKLQVGKFVFESVNNLGPSQNIIKYTRSSEVHNHNTRYAKQGNFFINNVRTSRYGLKGLQRVGSKIWATIPSSIKDCRSKKSFNAKLKKSLIEVYVTQ